MPSARTSCRARFASDTFGEASRRVIPLCRASFSVGAMRAEFLAREELMSQLHEQGLEDFSMVKVAYLEADGRVSIISREN